MKRYLLEIAFDGSTFKGWQFQPGVATVQGALAGAMTKVMGTVSNLHGCSRTDAGVHALEFIVHFDIEKELPCNLLFRLNRLLPSSVAVNRIFGPADKDFHVRFSAVSRSYVYRVHFHKDPFKRKYSAFFPWLPLDLDLMQELSSKLLDFEDFRMFSREAPESGNYRCELSRSEINLHSSGFEYHITANRFLPGMVRRITGTLIQAGKGIVSREEFTRVMEQAGKFSKNLSAPSQGLHQTGVAFGHLPPVIEGTNCQ